MADSRKILGVKGLNLHILANHLRIEEKFLSGLKITAVDGPCAVKYRFCVVNTLDGQTFCAVVYLGEEEFNAKLSSGFKYGCITFLKYICFTGGRGELLRYDLWCLSSQTWCVLEIVLTGQLDGGQLEKLY